MRYHKKSYQDKYKNKNPSTLVSWKIEKVLYYKKI